MSLIELLLAMTLSLLVLTGLTSIYLMMEEQRQRQAELGFVQDSVRAALQILHAEIHAAGYAGCARLSHDFLFRNDTVYPIDLQHKISFDLNQPFIHLWHRDYRANALLEPMTQATVLEVSSAVKITKGDLVLISDCRHAELFQVAGVSEERGRQRLQATQALRFAFAEDAELGLMKIHTYSVEETGRFDQRGQPIRGLYLRSHLGLKQEIVEGIERMAVRPVFNEQGKLALSIRLEAARGVFHKTAFAFVRLRQEG